jgi:GNAT superfamily N-acetyltransferase
MEFTTLLMDRKRRLREEHWANPVKRGSGVWGPEVNDGDLCFLDTLYVNEKQRGRGIGRAILERVQAEFTSKVY